MIGDLLVALLSGTLSLACVCFTYCYIKRLKFFEIFFVKKATAYERFLAVLGGFDLKCAGDKRAFSECVPAAQLYCSQENSKLLRDFADEIIRIRYMESKNINYMSEEYLEQAEKVKKLQRDVILALRKDFENCRMFKFD